jgi:D-glycero-D-manno-heptose 1,7-bisphosphate phosphatase
VPNRAIFLDRDGIFNQLVERDGGLHSPRDWNELVHYPGLENLAEAKALGYLLILVTNQPDIERQILRAGFCEELHAFYSERYKLDGVYVCPFASAAHPMKKPNPGMLQLAAEELDLDLSQCLLLGDTENDLECARRAGCDAILWTRPYNTKVQAETQIQDWDGLLRVLWGRV